MSTENNNDLQAAIERDRAAAVDKPHHTIDSLMAGKAPLAAVKATAVAAVKPNGITPASIRTDNNNALNDIADERKALNGEIAGIDEQMNALLDRRNAAIGRQMELAQAEAMIRAAQTVGNAPRWSQG